MSKNEFLKAKDILKMEIITSKKATSNELVASTQKYLKIINKASISSKEVTVK